VDFWWLLGGAVVLMAVLMMRNKDRMPWRRERLKEMLGSRRDVDRVEGDQAELWPDRTGPQTKQELGAREAGHEQNLSPGASPAKEQSRAEYLTWQYVSSDPKPDLAEGDDKQADTTEQPGNEAARLGAGQPNAGPKQPYVRREVEPGPHERGPGAEPSANLPPEAEFGESRPARRTTAPDQPPNMWEPEESGAPGDHIRDGGHHRSATAPTKRSDSGDPYAHAPVPGPNHVIPEGGDSLPADTRP
jgi:hypothetical protein